MKTRYKTRRPKCDLSGTASCVAFNLRRTARAVTNLYDSALQPSGVRSTQFAILVAVAKSQPVSIGRLAQLLLVDRTTLTRSLALMEKEGLLNVSERSIMRQRFVTLTGQGGRSLIRSVPLWRKAQRRYLASIGEGSWRRLQRELERLAKAVLRLEQSRASRDGVSDLCVASIENAAKASVNTE